MPLHPQAQAFVDTLATENAPGWDELGVEQSRATFETFRSMTGEAPAMDRVEEHTLPSGVRLRLYANGSDRAPVILFFHGGGWVLGNIDTHDALSRRLAHESQCSVCAVDYGLSPENPFPGPIEDCYQATEFVAQHADALNVDPRRLAVAGDSAGGHLATSVAIAARDRSGPDIALQVLMYPVIEANFDTESYERFAEGFGLTRRSMQWFWNHFLSSPDHAKQASPAHADNLSDLPDAIVVTAEYDVLCDEGVRYAHQLRAAGINVTHQHVEGMLHGFLHFAGVFDTGREVGRELAKEIGRRLR